MNSYTEQREIARAALLAKVRHVAPVPEPVAVIDSTLQDDTLALYNAIAEEIGMRAFGAWITLEMPMLLKPETSLLKTWWLLSNYHDELRGIIHRPWLVQP